MQHEGGCPGWPDSLDTEACRSRLSEEQFADVAAAVREVQ